MIRKKAATKSAKKKTKTPAARPAARAAGSNGGKASAKIDGRRRGTSDWRVQTLAKVRAIIQAADPEVVEERKWVKAATPEGVPVWSHGGILCTGETYKNLVKLTFAKGASLKDPSHLFNSSLDGNVRRAIDIHEHDRIDEAALKKLIQAAVALNLETAETRGRK